MNRTALHVKSDGSEESLLLRLLNSFHFLLNRGLDPALVLILAVLPSVVDRVVNSNLCSVKLLRILL